MLAPDVLGVNANASPTNGRSAGALNNPTLGAPYDTFKGHTLGSAAAPPGYDPTQIGASATWYTGTTDGEGLTCIQCHAQHGPAGAYRNLGPYALGGFLAGIALIYLMRPKERFERRYDLRW